LKPATPEKLERSYRSDIDGIRSLAILSVVLYHAGVPGLTGGLTGVDIFFVLSGYLIGGHIFSELHADRFSYLRFYQRRAKRILPAFFAVMIFTLAGVLLMVSPLTTYHYARSAFAATLSLSNFEFWGSSGYFDTGSATNPLLMTWSLGVEEQFYVVIPLLMVLLARVRKSWVLPSILAVCVASFVFSVLELRTAPSMVFYLLPSRAWELGVGVALAVFELDTKGLGRKRKKLAGPLAEVVSVTGLLAVLLPMVLITRATPFPGAAALPSVLGTAMLLATPVSWVNRRLLSLPPLVYIGRVSYSWYLWHWPLLAFVRIPYGDAGPPLTVTLPLMALAFGIAMLSYYWIEQPFRSSRRAPGPLLMRYAAASVVFLVVFGVVAKSHGFPARFPRLANMEEVVELRGSDPCLANFGVDQPNLTARCDGPDRRGSSVALWGDSHAGALAPGLRKIALGAGYNFVELGKVSCLPLIGAVRYTPSQPAETSECLRFNEKALQVIEDDPRIKLVIVSGYWANPFRPDPRETWLTADVAHEREIPTLQASRVLLEQALAETIRTLQAAGKRVIILGDTPSFDINPIGRVAVTVVPAERLLARWLRIPNADDPGFDKPNYVESDRLAASAIREVMAATPSAMLVDLKPAMCKTPTECFYRDGDSLLYADTHHLTPDGASFALRGFQLPALSPGENSH
jgi:peptidoglycan/LPS O-acetylase OafA/YrhL